MSYKISDLCPLFFGARVYEHENENCPIQVFATSDNIVLQIISNDTSAPAVKLRNVATGTETAQTLTKTQVNEKINVFQKVFILSEGIYTVSVGNETCREFHVTDSSLSLDDTLLLTYWHSSNNSSFDALFWNGTTKIPHYFRVSGGFKSQGQTAKLSDESFRTQRQEVRHLYSMPYLTETLTLGMANGLPSCYADKLNRIFCVDNVRIEGVPYARNDQSVPQLSAVMENTDRYWITMDVERQSVGIEGIGGMRVNGTLITSTASGVSFSLSDDVEDRSILQYDKSDGTWKDTTRFE